MNGSHTPPMVLELDGGHNFREVGGYPLEDGGSMRRGLVWRSAALDRLSADDCRRIEGLGVRTIVDLRTDDERNRFPTARGLAERVTTLASSRSGEDPAASWRPDGDAGWSRLNAKHLREKIAPLYPRIADAHALH